jgi:hypothetical protein
MFSLNYTLQILYILSFLHSRPYRIELTTALATCGLALHSRRKDQRTVNTASYTVAWRFCWGYNVIANLASPLVRWLLHKNKKTLFLLLRARGLEMGVLLLRATRSRGAYRAVDQQCFEPIHHNTKTILLRHAVCAYSLSVTYML